MNLVVRFLTWLSQIITESSDRSCEECGGPVKDILISDLAVPCCKACGRRQRNQT